MHKLNTAELTTVEIIVIRNGMKHLSVSYDYDEIQILIKI